MRIICPYTPNRLNPRTREALPKSTEFVQMTTFDSYQQLFVSLWDAGESFIIVEHDVVPTQGAIDQMIKCPHEWCGCPYGSGATSLGCIKIASPLIAKLPGLWQQMPLRHWQYCDSWFGAHAEKVSSVHMHPPVAAHLHVDNQVVPTGPLITRVRRDSDVEIEIAFYDPAIEFEFASVTLPKAKYSKERIKQRIASELDQLNKSLLP